MAFATNPKDGRRIYYEVQGRGSPLVLSHGTATSSMLWHELGYVEALADRRLILIDGRGHGRSDKPRQESAYRMDLFVADVLAVLDHLGIERTDFFGYSLGGRLGLALAAAALHRLYALAIGGGSHQPQRGALDRLIHSGFADTIETDGNRSWSCSSQTPSLPPSRAQTTSRRFSDETTSSPISIASSKKQRPVRIPRLA
jgi:pimeloyl-ACP methyl ester carboxylesterase